MAVAGSRQRPDLKWERSRGWSSCRRSCRVAGAQTGRLEHEGDQGGEVAQDSPTGLPSFLCLVRFSSGILSPDSSGEPSLVSTLHLPHLWASSITSSPGVGPRAGDQFPLLGSNHSFLPFLEKSFLPALCPSFLLPKAQSHMSHGSLLCGVTWSRVMVVTAGSMVQRTSVALLCHCVTPL